MPMYEYRCNSCGTVFELIQKFSDEPLRSHADCGGEVERLVSAPALQFKGSGWYVNDYAKATNGKKNGEGAEKPASAESAPKTDAAAAASKPAATPASAASEKK